MIQDRPFVDTKPSTIIMDSAVAPTVSALWQREDALPLDEIRKPKLIVGIPCYNEERSIAGIVLQARQYADEVIVVDDGSTDGTAELAEAAGAAVVCHEVNKGAGAATATCFKEARHRNADVLITLDGDGQHNPAEIPRVAIPALVGEADLVIGSRFLDCHKAMPRYRKLGINTITWLCNLRSGERITDTQSCFRAYSKKALHNLNSEECGYSFSVDLLIQTRRQNLRISEVPISCIYNDHSHNANPVMHGISVALAVVRLRLKALPGRILSRGQREPQPINIEVEPG